MARNLYSARFICQQGLNGPSIPVEVPPEHLYVIKQLTSFSHPLLADAQSHFRDMDTGATLFECRHTAGERSWFGLYGALVFGPGQRFQWEADVDATDGVDVYAGGYDLLAP